MMQFAAAKRTPSPLRLVRDAVTAPGAPLPRAVRQPLEARFGHSLERIRIHADPLAALSARALQASAYTVGRDIAFDTGRYDPASAAGDRLLSHEIAHAIQQDQSVSEPVAVDGERDGAESDARAAPAARGAAPACGSVAPGTVQRQPRQPGGSHEVQRTLPPPEPTVVPVQPGAGTTPSTAQTPTPESPASSASARDDLSAPAVTPTGEAGEAPHVAVDESLVTTTDFHASPNVLTRDFTIALTYRDFHLASPLVLGRHLDIFHEPSVFAQFSFAEPMTGVSPLLMGPLRNSLFAATASLLNYHLFSLHGKDLLEVSLDATAGGQTGTDGNALVGQVGPTAQLHLNTLLPQIFGGAETLLTANLSGSALIPIGTPPGGAPPPQPQLQFGQVSVGVKVQF